MNFQQYKILISMKRSKFQPRKLLQQNCQTIIKELELTGMLNKDEFQFIIESSISVLKFQPNILKTTSPAIIVGDIHGQFFDLIAIFRKHGLPPQTKYIFLGDYVDRGEFSIEVITLLFWLKLKYPKSIYLLRGNHQCRVLTNTHNFKQQCKTKYNIKIYELVIILFEVLPLCCIVDGKYFCVHAGISPSLTTLDQIQKVNRFCQIPQKGLMCDLLWSDPTDEQKKQWVFNGMRSCSYYYSREHVTNFLKKNSLQMILRGHEVHLQGFKYMQYKNVNKRNVLTIFSAPNYCDKYKNKGAVALIQKNDIKLDTFRSVEHPYVLPNNINIFEWSIGIITSQATKILIELAKSRLNLQKMSKSKELQCRQQIREKLQFSMKVEQFKKIIQDKELAAKMLCAPKETQNIPQNTKSQQFIFQPQKCLIAILMFMSEKKNDRFQQAMPTNSNAIQMIKNQEKQLYGDILSEMQNNNNSQNQDKAQMKKSNKSRQILNDENENKENQENIKRQIQFKETIQTTYLAKDDKQYLIIQQQSQFFEKVTSEKMIILEKLGQAEKIVENKKYNAQQNKEKQFPMNFGPKIIQFTKIYPKRK